MSDIRQSIFSNSVTPILSSEGCRVLINEYINALIEKRKFNTRKIALSSYKKPMDLSDNISQEEYYRYAFNIISLLINKMRKLCELNGDMATYNNLPNSYKNNFSYEQFINIFAMTDMQIMDAIKNYSGNPTFSFVNKLIDNSLLKGDRIGKENAIPYGKDVDHKKDADYRIYINTPNGITRYDFLELFIKKCIERSIPYEMKGEEHTGDEKDRTVVYCFDEYFDETVDVLEEIKKEYPDLIAKMGSPIATGVNYSFYAIATSRQGATYNSWFNRISSHAINYLFANLIKLDNKYYSDLSPKEREQIDFISDIGNYYFDSEGRFSEASNSIVNDYILRNSEKIHQDEIYLKLLEVIEKMCSLGNFNDLNHIDMPISLDANFYRNLDLTVKNDDASSIYSDKKELYLYHTEDLIANVLELYQQGDVSFNQLMDNYLKRITDIYKIYRHYALREPGFVMSERNKEVTSIFAQLLNGYELPEKMEGIEKLEYYQSVQSRVNDYLNNKGKII